MRSYLCAGFFMAMAMGVEAQVSATDTEILPVITDSLPVVGITTSYNHSEADVTSNATWAFPLFAPYPDESNTAFWDNLVSEQLQSRAPVIMLMTSGLPAPLGTAPITGTNGSNPYYIPQYIAALSRAGAEGTVKFGCCPEGVESIYRIVYGLPPGAPVDFSNEDSWENVWWKYEIGPWFAGIPKEYWYKLKGGVPIEFWGLGQTGTNNYVNQQGNISRFFDYINTKLQTTYGVSASFIVCDTATNYDTTLDGYSRFIGLNPWFTNSGYGFLSRHGVVTGTMVPGFNNGSLIIPRNGSAGTGVNGDTLKAGLNQAVSLNADLASLEGWVDIGEGAASWRCSTESATAQTANWDYPNQYANIVRSYTDLRTATLRLEAEACDKYSDPGGTGGVYRRSPATLDVTALSGGGWVVSNTKSGEWLEWDGLSFSPGNYKFPIRYSSTASHTVTLTIDGTALTPVTLPSTGSMATYQNALLGTKALTNGNHTLKLSFTDGGPNVDWIFVKKYDPLLTFKSALTSCYLTAEGGGNKLDTRSIVSNQTVAGAWENFTADDPSGAGTVSSGDSVNLQNYNGTYLTLQLGGGSGSTPQTNRRSPGSWEAYTIAKVSGSGALASGDTVSLKTSGGYYMTAHSDGTLDATGAAVGTAQTFTIGISQLDTVPDAPSDLAASPASGGKINLTWTDNSTNETAFIIERSSDGLNFAPIAQVGAGVTAYSDTGLPGYASYSYQVRASNPTGNSDPCDDAAATTLPAISAIPSGLSCSILPTLSGAAIAANWTAVPGATGYAVQRATSSGGPYTTLTTVSATTYTDSTAASGTTYYYAVASVNTYGTSLNSPALAIKPAPFLQMNIGTGTGSGTYSGGVFTATGSGGDITGTSDIFHFLYLPLNGDGAIVAHLASFSSTNGWAKAGVMMRETLTGGSVNAMMSITEGNGCNFQYRTTTGGASAFVSRVSGIVAPQWVKVVRSGSTYTGYYSADGVTWTQNGPVTATTASTIYVGLEASEVSTATFDSVAVTPGD